MSDNHLHSNIGLTNDQVKKRLTELLGEFGESIGVYRKRMMPWSDGVLTVDLHMSAWATALRNDTDDISILRLCRVVFARIQEDAGSVIATIDAKLEELK